MDTAAYILIILLSVTLIIFLIALTILIVWLTRISKTVKLVADRAEDVAENVAGASQLLKPAVISGMAAKFVNKVLNNETKGRRGK